MMLNNQPVFESELGVNFIVNLPLGLGKEIRCHYMGGTCSIIRFNLFKNKLKFFGTGTKHCPHSRNLLFGFERKYRVTKSRFFVITTDHTLCIKLLK